MSEELKAFKLAMRAHHPDATPAEESIAWRLWQSAWSEARLDHRPPECPRRYCEEL